MQSVVKETDQALLKVITSILHMVHTTTILADYHKIDPAEPTVSSQRVRTIRSGMVKTTVHRKIGLQAG